MGASSQRKFPQGTIKRGTIHVANIDSALLVLHTTRESNITAPAALMKSVKEILAYTMCLSLGVGLGLHFLPHPDSHAASGSASTQAKRPATARRSETTENRIEKIIRAEMQHLESSSKTIRESTLEFLQELPELRKAREDQYVQWLQEAKSMDENVDLASALTEALTSEDETRIAMLMVAWFARDSSSAFEQFRLRPALLSQIDYESPLWLALDSENVHAFLQKPATPKRVREFIIQNYCTRLADFGRMEEFLGFYSGLTRLDAEEAMLTFPFEWLPLEPEASAAFIHGNLNSPSVAALLDAMLESLPSYHGLWTDDFGKALLSKSLGPLESRRERIIQTLKMIDDQPPSYSSFPLRDDADVMAGAISPENIDEMIRVYLRHDRDWLEQFAQQQSSIEEIDAMLQAKIPGAEDHLVTLRQGLVKELWKHHPEQTIAWARGQMNEQELASCTAAAIGNIVEPRASRKQVLLDSISGITFTDESTIHWIKDSRARVERWHKQRQSRREK